MANQTQNILCIKSMFNSDIVENLYAGVVKCISESETIEEIQPIYVPGAFELPFMANKVINNTKIKVDCIITLGCVIKGETAHFEYISGSCANALANLNIHSKIPVLFGVVTAYNRKQAEERSQINFDHADNRNIGFNVANAAKILLSSETF